MTTKIRFITLLPALLISISALSAQETPASKLQADGSKSSWTVSCPTAATTKRVQCFTSQIIRWEKNTNLFTNFTVTNPANQKLPQLQITVPLGVLLGKGLTLTINKNEPVKLGFTKCIKAGCFIKISIADDMLTTLKNPSTKTAMIFGLTGKNNANVSFDMVGFAEAYQSMLNQQAAADANVSADKKK